jgi:hypothetical protein
MGMRWIKAACGGLVLVLTACTPLSGRLAEQRARLAEEQRARMAALDEVEGHLLDAQARVDFWNQLQERHAHVSAVACENATEHVASMEKQEQKERGKLAMKARRMAQLDGRRGAIRESHD